MASDIHLAADGIEGDSLDAGHEGEVEIMSFSHGLTMPIGSFSAGGSATHEAPNFQELIVTKNTDKSSPSFQKALLKGTHIASVVLTFDRPDGQGGKVAYIQYVLNDCLIGSYSIGSSGTGVPIETIGINFSKYYFVWVATDPATGGAQGNVESTWDLKLNKEP